MSERKNIDKLFQEKFKDFEAAPPEEVWPYLEEKLRKKKDRKVIPIWWKLSGIAAALLIGLVLADQFVNRQKIPPNSIVVEETSNGNQNTKTDPIGDSNPKSDAIVANPKSETPATKSGAANETILNPDQAVSNQVSQDRLVENSNRSTNSHQSVTDPKINSVAINENKATKHPGNQKVFKNHTSENFNPTAAKRNELAGNERVSTRKPLYKFERKSKHRNAEKEQLAESSKVKSNAVKGTQEQQNNSIGNPMQNPENPIAETKSAENPSRNAKKENNRNMTDPVIQRKPDKTAQNENKSPVKKLDSTAIATVVPNALEELLNEKENNLVTKGPHINRWQITSSVAPIYFGSTSGGSPIDSSFAGNSKNYKTNLSVRLGVNYAVNKRFAIRAGISQVTFDYNTNDVLISAGLQTSKLGNVNTNPQNGHLNFGRRAATENAAITGDLQTDKFASHLNQRMGYLEIPVELSYALLDKKVGINLIGGFSTLFLNENSILVVSDGMVTDLGEANNLNKVHYSSNIGLGLKYRFYRAFQASFEPMFKYQINTFSKGDGNFKPYYFGLYTGLSYSF